MWRFLIRIITLVLPIVFPSWRFFKTVEPSPRIQWAWREQDKSAAPNWQEFHPLQERLSWPRTVGQLFYNAQWNESLFLVSCAERLQDSPSGRLIDEIKSRVSRKLSKNNDTGQSCLACFRIIFVQDRDGSQTLDEVYVSDPFTVDAQVQP